MYFKINTDMEHNYYIVRFNVIKLESPPQKANHRLPSIKRKWILLITLVNISFPYFVRKLLFDFGNKTIIRGHYRLPLLHVGLFVVDYISTCPLQGLRKHHL